MNIEIEICLIGLNVDYAIMFISDDDIAVKCQQSDTDITFCVAIRFYGLLVRDTITDILKWWECMKKIVNEANVSKWAWYILMIYLWLDVIESVLL